jgi:hypothetical protein
MVTILPGTLFVLQSKSLHGAGLYPPYVPVTDLLSVFIELIKIKHLPRTAEASTGARLNSGDKVVG